MIPDAKERDTQDMTAPRIVKLLNHARPKHPALDRTNWKPGGQDIDVLVLALVTRRFRVPLLWMQPKARGMLGYRSAGRSDAATWRCLVPLASN